MSNILDHTVSAFRRSVPSGPTLLMSGVIVGLAWPALAESLRPFMPLTIFIFVLGTLLRLDVTEFEKVAKTFRVSVVLPITAMIASPRAMMLTTLCLGIDMELSLAMALAVAAPPSSSTAAVARVLGLNATIPLAATLISMAIAPLTVPWVSGSFGGISLNPVAFASRLTTLIGAAALTAFFLRCRTSRQLHVHGASIDCIVLLGLLAFAVATMAWVRQQIELTPATATGCVALAFGSNIALQIIGAVITSGTWLSE
jgi:BASS family bile acid:Na+ symporter